MKLAPRPDSRTLCLALLALSLGAISGSTPLRAQAEERSASPGNVDPMKMFPLRNAGERNDGNEILNAVRTMVDPSTKIYLVPSRNVIVVRGKPDQLALAAQIIDELDKPGKLFRLTYTINESDAGKRIGSQHFALIVHTGQRTTLKQGSKVPIATGKYGSEGPPNQPGGVQTQFTYLDVGYNFDVTLAQDGETLQSKVEQSSIAEERSGLGLQDPIVRQSVLQGTVSLLPGKPLTLGSLDLPGSTRHLDLEVLIEPVR